MCGVYLSCAPEEEVPPPPPLVFAWSKHLKSQDTGNFFKNIYLSPGCFMGCLGKACEEGKKKKKGLHLKKKRAQQRRQAKNVIKKIDGGSLRNYGYFGSGKLRIGTL